MGNDNLTITLTGRAPVAILKSEWPEIASSFEHDGEVECQANRRWRLKVRRHSDGRAIVYGVYGTAWRGEHDRRGGELLEAGADIPAAVYRVSDYLEFDRRLADECIADLPAERLA